MPELATLIASIAANFLADGFLKKVSGNDEDKKSTASRVIEKLLKGGFAGLDLNDVVKLLPKDVSSKVQDAIKKITGGDGTLSDDLIKKILQTCLGSASGGELG